jgi:hypothetical protein
MDTIASRAKTWKRLIRLLMSFSQGVLDNITATDCELENDQTGIFHLNKIAHRLSKRQLRLLWVFVSHVVRWPHMTDYYVEKTANNMGVSSQLLQIMKKYILHD